MRKKDKEKIKIRNRVVILVNMVIVFISLILYSMTVSVVSIADVLVKYMASKEILAVDVMEINKIYNLNIALGLSIFSVFELLYLAFFLFKDKSALKITLRVNAIISLFVLFRIIDLYLLDNIIILFISLFNGIIYYLFLKKNEKELTKKVRRLKY